MAIRTIIVPILTALAGCSAMTAEPVITTQAVEVPIIAHSTPPPELLEPIPAPGAIFVAPSSRTVVGLTDDGKESLITYVDALRTRVEAWEVCATQ